ncbi:hypothetical protein BOX15_Mlig016922g1 [Macrostomum lignano]|uniref:Uncharacterized protein n=2 Tax=Macrostomum lignano TaxID=282301 RepID=A0A267H957_9PLAT|nr:hypothetical protein BOX15_Mlig016922g1 [Macrostomum lignano]
MSHPSAPSNQPNVLHLPQLSITEENWSAGLQSLLDHVRPTWQLANCGQRLFTEGITNKLVALHYGERFQFGDDVILIRIYGEKTELIIDRQAEVRNMRLLHLHGFCKPVYATFANGLCYGYVHGDVADEELVREPTFGRLVARELASLHCLQVPSADGESAAPQPMVFATMRRFLELGPDEFPEPDRQARFRASLPDKAALRAEVADLEAHLVPLACPVVFSHNDTLIKNFVYDRREQRVFLIDFEYCAHNYLPFDLANHFNEFAGVATVDHSRYPSREFQLPWLRNYLQYRDGFLGGGGAESLDSRVEQLYREVTKFSLASHLLWALWALVQARHSTIDFDFLDYAISRYGEYKAKKAERLAC